MIDADRFDMYLQYRYVWNTYHTDSWDVLWAALWFASSV
jgi:hypothetical protein